MDLHTLAQRARDAAPRLGRWALRRAEEKSTWTAIALLAGDVGLSQLARTSSFVADHWNVLVALFGTGLAAATTTPHHPDQPQG